jgi:hypothetical protein
MHVKPQAVSAAAAAAATGTAASSHPPQCLSSSWICFHCKCVVILTGTHTVTATVLSPHCRSIGSSISANSRLPCCCCCCAVVPPGAFLSEGQVYTCDKGSWRASYVRVTSPAAANCFACPKGVTTAEDGGSTSMAACNGEGASLLYARLCQPLACLTGAQMNLECGHGCKFSAAAGAPRKGTKEHQSNCCPFNRHCCRAYFAFTTRKPFVPAPFLPSTLCSRSVCCKPVHLELFPQSPCQASTSTRTPSLVKVLMA